MILTVGGPPGSGKTTIARMLSEKLGLELVVIGDIFRAMAKERGLSLAQFGDVAAQDHTIDLMIDKRTVDLAQKGNLVLEGRLAGVMMRTQKIRSFKIWLDAALEERAKRIAERENQDPKAIITRIEERQRCEKERYSVIYDIDFDDRFIYDLVIDTSDITPEDIVKIILDQLEV